MLKTCNFQILFSFAISGEWHCCHKHLQMESDSVLLLNIQNECVLVPEVPKLSTLIWGLRFPQLCIQYAKILDFMLQKISLGPQYWAFFFSFCLLWSRSAYSTCSINYATNFSRCKAPATLCVWFPCHILTFWVI